MAKKSNNDRAQLRVFIIAGIVLTVFILAVGFMGYQLYKSTQKISLKSQVVSSSLNHIDNNLLLMNRDVLMIINGSGDIASEINEIAFLFDEIEEQMKIYESEERDPLELRRYTQAKNFIIAYHDKLLEFQDSLELTNLDFATVKNIYIQELHPLQVTSQEMFQATLSLGMKNIAIESRKSARILFYFELTLGVIWIVTIVTLVILGTVSIRRAAELAKREAQVSAFDAKLQSSRQKINDIANMNVLTGMKNRYALEADITDRLETDEFVAAVFDLDNFRSINDIYGYEFGDEYLAQVAERVRSDYGDKAEIYNITGNEFCFIFNNDVSYQQAIGICQNVLASMSGVYNVLNIGVQLSASGSVYHYSAGDVLNVSSLLVRLDNVMRNVKRNGGNAFAEVVNM